MPKIRYNAPFTIKINGEEYVSWKKRMTAADILDLAGMPKKSKVFIVSPDGKTHEMDYKEEIDMFRYLSEWLYIRVEKPGKPKPKKIKVDGEEISLWLLNNYKGRRYNKTKGGYPNLADFRKHMNRPDMTKEQRDRIWDEFQRAKDKKS